jgi:hypothetical protein
MLKVYQNLFNFGFKKNTWVNKELDFYTVTMPKIPITKTEFVVLFKQYIPQSKRVHLIHLKLNNYYNNYKK